MKIAIAPMIDWTDRHYRYIMRQITCKTTLYTEMITTGAILHGSRDHILGFSTCETPLILQLGGSDPDALAQCAIIAEQSGYSEVNLNVGCPSDRVQKGAFGLSLMNHPKHVARCVTRMKSATNLPVSIKCRTGVDHNDSYAALEHFIRQQFDAGADHICIHARKGWLTGLSPKENRTIPPLDYERVYDIKAQFPNHSIGINGGIDHLSAIEQQLYKVDYAMIGRAAYHNPFMLADVDRRFFNAPNPADNRVSIVENLYPYIEAHLSSGGRLNQITRHLLGLFHAQPKGKLWRNYLSTYGNHKDADITTLQQALELVR